MKIALVCGAGGFIGSHMVNCLKQEGIWIRGVDLKYSEFSLTQADDFVIGDLRDAQVCKYVVDRPFDEVYQFAADMGGRGLFSPAKTTLTSCIIRLSSTLTCLRLAISEI